MVIISEYRAKVPFWKKLGLVVTAGVVVVFAYRIITQNTIGTHSKPTGPSDSLVLPFEKGASVRVAEGWLYSQEERAIHGRETHYGIDFAAERGTPVYAAADGLAIASFDTEEDGYYQNKKLGFGYGKFIQVWDPTNKLFVIYSHLETLVPTIYYEEPTKTDLGWKPLLPKSEEEVLAHQNTSVKKGDLLGYVGDSGLTWGYEETPTTRPDPARFPSWDETHLHFEVFRYDADGEKEALDPYGIYNDATKYTLGSSGQNPLWQLENGIPQYAR